MFDLNNFSDIVGDLTLHGGTISSGSGVLTTTGNLTTLASANEALITGNLVFSGGLRTITVADGGAFYDLNLLANVSDSGGGLLFTNFPAGGSWARLTGSNIFGSGEYYMGMFSGMVRFACMIFFALALLNAPVYTPAEIQAHKAYAMRWFGGGLYGGDYIPDMHTVQESVFKKSFLGPYIKDYLGTLLINTAPPESKKPAAKTGVITIRQ